MKLFDFLFFCLSGERKKKNKTLSLLYGISSKIKGKKRLFGDENLSAFLYLIHIELTGR